MTAGYSQEALTALLPDIVARRDEIERARRIPSDLAQKLKATGVFTIQVPRAIGGLEMTPMEIMRTIETVAKADGSVGWCTMIGISGNGALGLMNEPGAKELFDSPTMSSASIAGPIGAAVPTDGGFTINGRWPFASGITHAEKVWAGCIVMRDGAPVMTPMGPQIIHAWMPIQDVEIHDTWYVSGLCGTGSNDFSAADVFVQDAHTFSLFDPSGHRQEALYRMPVVSAFVSEVASVSLGIARGAIEDFISMADSKMPTMSHLALADRAVTQVDLARAEAALASARAYLYDSVEDQWGTVTAGNVPSMRQVAAVRAACIHAAETASAVTRTLNTLAGGSAIYSGNTFQRAARDTEAVTHHFTVAPHTWEDTGRVLLGREPLAPLY